MSRKKVAEMHIVVLGRDGKVTGGIPVMKYKTELLYEDYCLSEACRLADDAFERWRVAGMLGKCK